MVQSACGYSRAATGPFYCPADRKVYIDLSFFRELSRLGGPGDFARAYVIGHEIGHHVQNLAGTSTRVRQLQGRASRSEANALSVMLELQADCYAGVWAHHTEKRLRVLEPGDIEEGLNAAAAIGDDRLQRASGRGVQPESFTHGSSAQRVEWLRTGLSTGNLEACDTFERMM
jgi:predicted metalloprotease